MLEGQCSAWGGAQNSDLSVQEGREGSPANYGMTWRPLVEEKLGATKLIFSLIGSLIKGTVLLTIFREIILYKNLTCILPGKKINTQN